MNDLSRPSRPNLPNTPSSSSSSRRTLQQVPSGPPTAHPLPAPVQPPLAETKKVSHVPCKFFRSGGCTAGTSCIFAHIPSEAGQQKQPCQYFQKGSCKFGRKCALAHILPGQPMSMDRKNKKAAEVQAQALSEKIASSLLPSSPSTLPPIPRTNSNGTPSTAGTIPAKPISPSKPNGLPPNPLKAVVASRELPNGGSQSDASKGPRTSAVEASSPVPLTGKTGPVTTKGFSFASLFPGSSSAKPSSNAVLSSHSPATSTSSALSNPTPASSLVGQATSISAPSSTQAPTRPNEASSGATCHASLSPLHLTKPDPSSATRPPATASFGFGTAVRAPNGTGFPPVQRKDIVFGTTNIASPPPSLSPPNSHLSSNLSPQLLTSRPTPIAPPHARRTSHGPVSPPTSSSSHSPHSFHPSPQHFHPTPTPLSPTRRLIPPLSSSSSFNAGAGVIGGGANGGSSPFSSSPFFPGPLGSRAVFLSASYENHDFDRSDSFSGGIQGGQPASMVDGGRWGGRGELDGEVGGRTFEEEDGQSGSDDGEELLPSSLSELLTEQEMGRRMSRRGSNAGGSSAHQQLQQHLPQTSLGAGSRSPFVPPPPHTSLAVPNGLDDHQARLMGELNPIPRGHNSVPPFPSAIRSTSGTAVEMRSPWHYEDEVVGSGGTGRTIGRGRNTVRRAPVPFGSSPSSSSTVDGGLLPGNGERDLKLGPSHASVAFLPNFGERKNPFGHDPQPASFAPQSASLVPPSLDPTSSSSNGFPSALSNSFSSSSTHPNRWNPPSLASTSTTATTNINTTPTLSQPHQQQHPSPQFGGFGQPQNSFVPSRRTSTATLMGPPLTPAELAASHEPGMSLPPGLGIGLGRTRIPYATAAAELSTPYFASGSTQPQAPVSAGPWGSTSSCNGSGMRPPPLGGARWITSVGGGARGGVVEHDAEDEIEDDVMFR